MKVILKETLKNKGISQYQLAKDTGIAASTINNLCNGKTSSADFEMLQKICTALQCDVSAIMQPDPIKKPFTINVKKDDTK